MPVYRLRDKDRAFFRSGVGSLISSGEPEKNIREALGDTAGRVFTVGDVCTHLARTEGFSPDLVVFDRTTQRTEPFDPTIDEDHYTPFTAANPAGQISEEAFRTLKEALEDLPAALEIDGEEDLLTAALIHLASPGDTILYGDPGLEGEEGLRKVTVDRHLQDRIRDVLGLPEKDETGP